ncbi:hypothetical protein BgAZ_303070 [Babesia gibsoni]|uniref:Uncharacterized protein n=1 Tax=Babesia gibsoni TaxID=33632 RepID=A0AAD8PDH9_BABGI|nr:hypothetical protein BgAZ_303070 [Babesia gibsoni]
MTATRTEAQKTMTPRTLRRWEEEDRIAYMGLPSDPNEVEEVRNVPLLRGYVHLILSVASPFLVLWLCLSVINVQYIAEYALSFTCCILNFASSTFVHFTPSKGIAYDLSLKMDYACIFLMIGGSGLPGVVAAAKSDTSIAFILLQWIGITMGVIGSCVSNFVTTSSPLRVFIYFSLGFPYVIISHTLYHIKCFAGVISIVASLALYGAGGIIYAYKAPNPLPYYVGFHEVFHLCCAMAVACTVIGSHKITTFVNAT